MTMVQFLHRSILAFIALFAVCTAAPTNKPTTYACLAPLLAAVDADPAVTMCQLMDGFTQCYIDSDIPKGDEEALQASLQAMARVMQLFKEEGCDLNAEFNNQCTADFVDCIGHVTGNNSGLICSDAAYQAFIQCTEQELEPNNGLCYFTAWQQKLVNETREVTCAGNNPVVTPPSEVPTDLDDSGRPSRTEDLGPSDGYCDVDGVRYHAYSGCTVFQMEWLEQGILFSPQPVAAGTLFDTSICSLNHEYLVTCGTTVIPQ